jgi:hypothetical protein
MIDLQNHPITDSIYLASCRSRLHTDGALILRGFFSSEAIDSVLAESTNRDHQAFFASTTHNVWLTEPDETLPVEHIFNRQIVSTKGLLADDQLEEESALRIVYDDPDFRAFIASVVNVDGVYPYADALSSINVHFHRDGEELGWHFDNSSFAVTALIQAPKDGGAFEYVTDLRDAEAGDQNFGGVEDAIVDGEGVETLEFDPGDLVLFRGRNSMHRVTPSKGDRTRILAVFAFNTEPDIGLSDSAKQTFYGRL